MGNCDWHLAQISACLDGALSETEQRELMEHLAVCEDCRAYFNDQLAIQEALSALEAPAPEGFSARVMEQVRAENAPETERKTIRFPGWKRWAALAACCAVVCLGVWGSGVLRGPERIDAAAAQQDAVAEDADPAEAPAARSAAGDPAKCGEEEEADGAEDIMLTSLEPDSEPAASPAAPNRDMAPAQSALSADGTAQKAQGRAVAQSWTLTADGPAARAWVEEELEQSWEPGGRYLLTEEQYAALVSWLAGEGEAFSEAPGTEGEGWYLLAGAPEPLE